MPHAFVPLTMPMRTQAQAPSTGTETGTVLQVHRAETFVARLAGLLFKPPLQPCQALLLVPCASVHTAFMRYAIDVVFLDRAGVIQKIVPNLQPWRMAACSTACQTLELADGQAAVLQLQALQRWPKLDRRPAAREPAP